MSKSKELGYKFYPQDWQSDDQVFKLSFTERGIYRELIDRAYQTDNNIKIEIQVWSRLWNLDQKELELGLIKLEELGLLERVNNSLKIPSCEARLVFVRSGKKGGKASVVSRLESMGSAKPSKGSSKRPPNQTKTKTKTKTESRREREEEIVSHKAEIKPKILEVFKAMKVANPEQEFEALCEFWLEVKGELPNRLKAAAVNWGQRAGKIESSSKGYFQ